MRILKTLIVLLCTLLPLNAYSQGSPRQRISLDANWRFHLAPLPMQPGGTDIMQWRWKSDDNGVNDAAALAAAGVDTSGTDWNSAATGDDVFNGKPGYAWFRTVLPDLAGSHRLLMLKVDDNADVYLNGQQLTHHEGYATPFFLPLDTVWKQGGPNELAILVQNTYGGGGVDLATLGYAQVASADPSQPRFDDSTWRTVHVPHDFVVEGAFTPKADSSHGSLPTQPAWYRRHFTVPVSDKEKSIWIDFDGVYRDSIVYLNGIKLGEFQSGYAPFRYDISTAVKFGAPNVVAVSVDPTAQEGWWYEGGGIYRHVWLNVADPVHVAPYGTYVVSQLPEPVPGQTVSPAKVTVQTQIIAPAGDTEVVRLSSEIYDPAGDILTKLTQPVTLSSTLNTVTQSIVVQHPRLWSLDQTNMYTLKTAIYKGGQRIDTYTTPFGIRTIRFDANNGFFLNGKSVKIQGTCNHQDFAGVGIAVPDNLEWWRVKTLKSMGSNGWRTSHNPPTESLLDACDRLGMVVMDENRHLGDTTKAKSGPKTSYADLSELDTMIMRDRNHPSIIMWSMCNEEPLEGSSLGAKIFTAMRDSVRTLDTTRPITCAMDGGYQSLDGFSGVEDLQGINYHPWDYIKFHEAHPAMPIYGSETASTVSTRGVYTQSTFTNGNGTFTGNEDLGWVSAYDTNHPPWAETAHDSWAPQAEQPFVAGGFAWTGFDYKGEPTPFGWPDINSNFGIVDECGFPKDNYYYYKAWWTDQPVVHILPHWNWTGSEGKAIPVWVYSNAASVDLLVNGVSQGKQNMPPNGHLEWSVLYAPGTLIANGYDAGGKLMGSDKVETSGSPAGLKLVSDETALPADGESILPVEVDVVDSQGYIVPTAGNKVTFTVTGPGMVAGVGNGNPSDHDPDKADYRSAFNGKCLVDVGSGETPGVITLTASSPGLAPATMTIHSTQPGEMY